MSGNRIALDAVDAIAVLNEEGEAGSWTNGYGQVFLPVTVVGELRFGALNSARVQDNLDRLERLIVRCTLLEIDLTTARFYAEVRLALKRKGKPIPENDLWIAAICKQHDLPLSSLDEHFSNVDGLTVVKRQ